MKRNRILILAVTGLILAVLIGGGIFFRYVNQSVSSPYQNGDLGGDFTLHGQKGDWSLAKDGHGSLVLLYFGYTRCPDVCPMTMATIRTALLSLNPSVSKKVMVVFVSVDYKSDTPDSASKYASYFGPSFVGLTGSKVEIDKVTTEYGASYVLEDEPKSAMGYSIEHSGRVFFIDANGNLKDAFLVSTDNKAVTARIEDLL